VGGAGLNHQTGKVVSTDFTDYCLLKHCSKEGILYQEGFMGKMPFVESFGGE